MADFTPDELPGPMTRERFVSLLAAFAGLSRTTINKWLTEPDACANATSGMVESVMTRYPGLKKHARRFRDETKETQAT